MSQNYHKVMIMAQACPINYKSADNTLSRIGSLLTTAIVAAYLFTESTLWLFALGLDLLVRLYGQKQYSPVFQISKLIKEMLRLPAQKVDSAAKNVAGHFGLLFILLLIAASYLELDYVGFAVAGTFMLCLMMDVLFSFCLGCKIYYIYRLFAGNI